MSSRRPDNRSARRRRYTADYGDVTKMRMSGLLGVLTNPKIFVGAMLLMGAAMLLSVIPGISTGRSTTDDEGRILQQGEIEDKPQDSADATAQPQTSITPTVKRYETAPPLAIDTSKRYVATVKTTKGDFQIELDPRQAPEAVNSFIFLAFEGYYNNTPFMQLVKNQDGSKFVTQAGDPTCKASSFCQALGTPGYWINKETTTLPFDRGAVGMGGSSPTSNGGQFFISFGRQQALDGKYTIFGRVISGMEVVDRLSLLDLTPQSDAGQADTIISITLSGT